MIKLQVCRQCQAVHYPERDICPACLSQDLMWQEVASDGTLISATELYISAKSQWQNKLPLSLGLVKLDVGPKILAFDRTKLPTGSKVILTQDGETFTIQNRGE